MFHYAMCTFGRPGGEVDTSERGALTRPQKPDGKATGSLGRRLRRQWLDAEHGTQAAATMLAEAAAEEAAAAAALGVRRVATMEDLQCKDPHLDE